MSRVAAEEADLEHRPRFHASVQFFYANFAINAFASFLNLVLMYYMWKHGRMKMNLYQKCVLQLTSFQLIYEIFDPLRFEVSPAYNADGNSATLRVATIGLLMVSGIGVSMWSLMMLIGAAFTVQYHRLPTRGEQLVSFLCINTLLIAFAIPCMMATYTAFKDTARYPELWVFWQMYDYIRIVLILISILAIVFLIYVMIKLSSPGERWRSPLYHLLRKIVPYTLFLLLSRFGASGYKFIYNESPDAFPEFAGGWQTFWLYLDFALTPLVGIGFLATFVNVTAGARRSLLEMLWLDRIISLPRAPAVWAERQSRGNDHRLEHPKDVIPPPSAPGAHTHEATDDAEFSRMSRADEDELAAEVSAGLGHFPSSASTSTLSPRMHRNEEWGNEI